VQRRRILPLLLYPALAALGADIPLTDPSRLQSVNAQIETTTYRGRAGLKIVEKDPGPGGAIAILKDVTFHDGTIELEVSGAPSKTADPTARGFIGIAFRLPADGSKYENFYLRPTNARSDDQLARNHSVQYTASPDWPWRRLREETPGQYESYADMQAGEWTRMRIVARGGSASLYVGGAEQPCLVVKQLKLGDSEGGVALWIGPGTEGYFRNLTITPAGTARK
jgi:hypothetical protein